MGESGESATLPSTPPLTPLSPLGQWSSPSLPLPPLPTLPPIPPLTPPRAPSAIGEATLSPLPLSLLPQAPLSPEAEEESAATSVVFKERWRLKERRLRLSSPVGHMGGWRLLPLLLKVDDVRQEELLSRLLLFSHHVLQLSPLRSYLRPYHILSLADREGRGLGLIEAVPDTVSLDLLRQLGHPSLSHFFLAYFGDPPSPSLPPLSADIEEGSERVSNPPSLPLSPPPSLGRRYRQAQQNFIFSLAQYSVLCYLLQIRDRHNGNILLTTHGHIVHIDFGFALGASPGGNLDFEQAAFKLTSEYVEIMGGLESRGFLKFREVCKKTFLELRKHSQRMVLLLEMLSKGNEGLACFAEDPQRIMKEVQERFFPTLPDHAAAGKVSDLIDQALDHWSTNMYDQFQKCCVGIQ